MRLIGALEPAATRTVKLLNKVLRGSLLNVVDLVLKAVATMVLIPLMIHNLGLSGYGLWLLVMAVASYCGLLDLGITFTASRFAAAAIGSGNAHQEAIVLQAAGRYFHRIAGVILLISPLVVLGTGHWVPDSDHGKVKTALAIVLITMAGRFTFRQPMVLLRAAVRHDLIALTSISRSIIQSYLMFQVLISTSSVVGVALVQMAGEVVELFMLRCFAAGYLKALVKPDQSAEEIAQISREMRAFAGNMSLIMVGDAMRMQTNPLIVNFHRGVEAVPIYSVGMRLLTILQDMVSALFGGTVLAAFSQLHGAGDAKALRDAFLRYSELAAAFSGCGVLGCVWLAPAFFIRWVGADFEAASQVMLILAIPYGLYFAQYPAHNLMFSLNRSRPLAKMALYGGAASAVLSFIFGGFWGINGVVAGVAVEMMVSRLVVVPLLMKRAAGVSACDYLLNHLGVPALKTLVLPACFAYVFRGYVKADYGQLAWVGATYVLIATLSFLLFALRREDREIILKKLRGVS